MISAVNMKEVKRKVSSAFFADGLWDILLGIFLMLRVIWVFFPELYMSRVLVNVMAFALTVCCAFGFIIVLRVKNWMTLSRIGYARITAKKKGLIIALLCICICSFLLPPFLITYSRPVFEMHSQIHIMDTYLFWLFLPVLPIVCIFVARFFSVRRWYLYALWIVGCWLGVSLINNLASPHDNNRWMMDYLYYHPFVMGGVILCVGVVTLIRFLRNNPKLVLEELHEQSQSE